MTPSESDATAEEIIRLNQQLLQSITDADWTTYAKLCDPTLTAFEPEARGRLVSGMDFHRFYFDLERTSPPSQSTMSEPRVRMLSPDAALLTYVRLVQSLGPEGPRTTCFEETRVWQRQDDGRWRHVHFHRSSNP